MDLADRPPGYHPPRGRRPAQTARQGDRAPAEAAPLTARRSQGPPTRHIAELKCINAGPTRYPRGGVESRDKAVNRRARLLPNEYKMKLQPLDEQYYNTPPGVAGPLVQRLQSMGTLLELVVGAFGKVSADMERIVVALAHSRALYLSREEGRTLSDSETGVILGQYRRLLSCTFVRSTSSCLLARMGHWERWPRPGQRGGRWQWWRRRGGRRRQGHILLLMSVGETTGWGGRQADRRNENILLKFTLD